MAAVSVRILVDFSTHDLEQYCRKRDRLSLFEHVMDVHDEIAHSARIVMALAGIGAVATFSIWWITLSPSAFSWIWLGAGVLAMIAAQVWIPTAIATHWASASLYRTWPLWLGAHQFLAPLRWFGRMTTSLAGRLAAAPADPRDEEELFEDEIRSMVTAGEHEGLLEADMREMIEGIIELDQVDVAEIMTPRSEIEALEVNSDWSLLMAFLIRVGRTRIPVYEHKLDHIVGILHAKDILPELLKPAELRRDLPKLVREAWFVPESKRVDELLREFRLTRKHLAIVLDEYQSVAGVVTIEDALEQIVGEIDDEHDPVTQPDITRVDGSTVEVSGRTLIDEINEELGLELPESDDYDTIAGWLIYKLCRFPDVGEQLIVEPFVMTVLQADTRSIQRLRFQRLPETPNVDDVQGPRQRLA